MLEKLSEYHYLWVSFVSKHCGDYSYRQDIVQEMYLKAHRTNNKKEIVIDGEVNKNYVFSMLSSLCKDFERAKNRVKKEDVTDYEDVQPPCYGMEIETIIEIDEIHHQVRKKLREQDSYWERLYLIKTSAEKPSYREISKETGIARSTLHRDFKTIEKIIRTG